MEIQQFWVENLVALLGTGFFSSIVSVILTNHFAKRKAKAETDQIVIGTMKDLIAMAHEEAEKQSAHRLKCEADLAMLQEKVRHLESVIHRNGHA